MKAIVADDSRVMRSIIEKAMRSLGYEIIHAGNGQEVLEILEKERGEVDLILLDWNMPVLNGFTTLLRIRESPVYSEIPVLMVSTESEEEKMERALNAGARGYIPKPFTLESLASAIRKILGT
jgi:two-component system, chemotaxis family, chemotaxis protein CheY